MPSNLYTEYAATAAAAYGIPNNIFQAQISVESSWNPNAISSAGAVGLAQLLPSTAADMGYSYQDLLNPQTNLNAGAQYLKKMYDIFGNWRDALAGYNAGSHNLRAGYDYADKILNAANSSGAASNNAPSFSFTNPSTWFPAILAGVKPYAVAGLVLLVALVLIFTGIKNGFINTGK